MSVRIRNVMNESSNRSSGLDLDGTREHDDRLIGGILRMSERRRFRDEIKPYRNALLRSTVRYARCERTRT